MQVFGGELLDRDAELAELSEFAVSGDGCPYAWWQGDAWTGKSALMAAFALNPPPGVHVVSFFITARFAGQSDRTAFLEAVLGQLSEFLDQAVPAALTESSQQMWFLELLEQAAERCMRDGFRLALVVDGLDEDRGMSVGEDVHSIAALLPGRPPAGVRIILAGRPAPPVPADVPAWHPLHSPAIVRPLPQSAHAVVMRGDARRELTRLLYGGGLGRELLGLVVTTGGGLAGEDLAELADEPVGEVERILHTVTGRTFASRDRQWTCQPGNVFVLAHEELQQAALRSLRSTELTRWQAKIHAWAETYKDHGWPEGTPEYLLRGYLRMLRSAGDLTRMVALSTDLVRLDRMLDVSGGDAAALAEIRAVHRYITDQPIPDLVAAVHLAYAHRDLISRNANIPAQLPAVWAVLGNLNRAEALTQSIEDPFGRAEALGHLAMAAKDAGHTVYAAKLVDDAEDAARSIVSSLAQARARAWLSRVIAQAGNLQRAEDMARSVPPESSWDRYALVYLAEDYAKSGDIARARSVAVSCSHWSSRAEALTGVARIFAKAGDFSKARLAVDDAETAARSAAGAQQQAPAMAAAAEAAAAAGDLDRARLLIDDAETLARSVTDSSQRASALTAAAEAAATAGDPDRARLLIDDAEAPARSVTDEQTRNWRLAELATAVANTGDLNRAEAFLHSVTGWELASTLRSWSEAAAEAGDLERAEIVARSIADLSQQAPALEELSEAVARSGDLDRAEIIADSIVQSPARASALASAARAAAEAGNFDRARLLAEKAEATARSAATEKQYQAAELASAACALAEAGHTSQARTLAESTETIIRSISQIPDESDQKWALASAARAAAAAGDPDKAEAVARLIGSEEYRASVLASLAQAAIETGDLDRATRLIGEVEKTFAPFDGNEGAWLMEPVAATVARTGNLDRAISIARSVMESSRRASALASVAQVAAGVQELSLARALITEAEDIIRSVEPDELDWPRQALSAALGSVGEMERAESTARSISHLHVQDRALEELTRLASEQGDLDKAESIARSMAWPQARGNALTRFARTLCGRGDYDKARHILSEALMIGDPITAIPALAAIDAEVIEFTMHYYENTYLQGKPDNRPPSK
jgi:tetratricopeptide (TPR) repeat protein